MLAPSSPSRTRPRQATNSSDQPSVCSSCDFVHFVHFQRPAFVDGEKTLQGAIPISWQVSAGKLRGGKGEESDVLCWVNFAESTLRPAVMAWVLPATSCMANCETSHKAAQSDSLRLLGALNDVLVSKTFLVGERLSLADIHTAFTLLPAYQYVIEPATTQVCHFTTSSILL